MPALKERLPRPRLLPVTIATMSALLAIKSTVLVKAAAEEAQQSSKAPMAAATDNSQGSRAPNADGHSLSNPSMQGRAAKPASCTEEAPVSDAEKAILLDLRHRRTALEAWANDLDEKKVEIATADRQLDERIQQLAALQTRLEGLEAARLQHSSENWAGLVKTYEAMKPRDAATIFDALDMQVLLQVLDRIQERRAAPILAAMQPDRARLATQMLAEMRTRAVTPSAATSSQAPIGK